jgi:hypothetical protein
MRVPDADWLHQAAALHFCEVLQGRVPVKQGTGHNLATASLLSHSRSSRNKHLSATLGDR